MSLTSFMAADRAALFADAPVTLTSGVQTTPCWVDEEDMVVEVHGGQALERQTVVRYRLGAITAPTRGASVTLGADSYKVRDLRTEGDGGVMALIVSRA